MHLTHHPLSCSAPSQMLIMVAARILDALQVATLLRLALELSPGLRSCKALWHCLLLKQMRTSSDSVLPLDATLSGKVKESIAHILSSLVIPQDLDFALGLVLSIGLELLERLEDV